MSDMVRVMVFDRTDAYRCDIDPDQIMAMDYEDALNGVHSLTITTTQELEKTDRLLIRDGMGIWHEYVVLGVEADHGDSDVVTHEHYCVWSMQYDMSVTFVDDMYGCGYVPGHPSVPQAASHALEVALEGTSRWQVGTVTVTNMASASFYRCNGWEALQKVIERWGGELRATITVGANGVVERRVDLLAHLGQEQATRRFDYGADLTGIRRIVSDDPWPCRIVPLGKSVETENGGYTRRPDIADVNDGVMWIEDAEVAQLVRIPDGHGGWEYPTTIVTNDTYEDPSELKSWALEHITDYTRPQATYEADVAQFVAAGMNPHGVSLGDEVAIVDRTFCEGGLRLNARVVKIKGSMLDPTDMELTIGNAKESLSHNLSSLSKRISGLEETVGNSSAYQATAAYLSNLLDRLNAEINATGGYWYMVPGLGTRTYDAEVSDPAVGTEASKVVEVRGGNIRIADSRTSGGDWNWRTVFTSGHILADLVTAAKLTAGYIGSADSGNYWNLDTGEFRMASTSMLGNKTVQQVINGVDATITGVDVEYASNTSPNDPPTSGWSTTAPQWQSGHYIWSRTVTTNDSGTSYSTPVMISGRDGIDGTDGTSVTIKGSYDTLAQLQAAHPTGTDGDAYMVGADLYVWNGSAWENVGQIQGPQGPAGQDGTSVTVTSIQYGTSTSASTSPTSWSTTPPTTIAAGRWLWVRTNYSNGSTATTKSYIGTDGTDGKSVYVQSNSKVDGVTTIVLANTDGTTSTIRIADGEDGANGQPGPAGADGESTYIHVAWANSADGKTDFSTTVSTGKSYLGVYTDSNTADSTSPSKYSWSKIEGEQGEEGVGVSQVIEQYYLSTSSSTLSGGSWQTTPPAYVKGRFYWTRSQVTWTDGSVTNTTAVLARGINSANNTADTAKDTADTAKSTADTAKSTADAAKNTATNVQSALNTLNTQSGVFNKLTNSGALRGLYMSGGQLYVNATYLHAGTISSLNNQSFWDLENNLFQILGNDATVRVGRGDGQGNLKAGVLIDTGLHVVTEYGEVFNAQETGGVNRGQDPDTGEWVSYKHAQIKITNSHGTAGLTIKTSGLLMIPAVAMQGDGDVTISAGTDYTKTVTVGCPSSNSKIGSVYINGNSVYSGATTFHINGRFTANVKNRMVETKDYGKRLLYCYETPAPMFGDVGSAVTDEHGECVVAIDPVFAETMRTDYAYQVFLQKCGRGELWVAEKRPDCFVVMGTPNLPFDWELKGRQVGLETERLEEADVIGMVESASTAADVARADVGFDADSEYVQTTEDLAFQALSEEGPEQ